MEVAVQRKPEEIAEAVTQAVGRTMIADSVFWLPGFIWADDPAIRF